MPKFRNVSGKDFSILVKGRRIPITAGAIIEGDASLKNYRALKEVTDLEYDRHVKHMPKFLKANPMHKLRSFINSNSNSSEYSMRLQNKTVLDSNIKNSTEAAIYADAYPKDKKPVIFIQVSGDNVEDYKKKISSITTYPSITFVDNIADDGLKQLNGAVLKMSSDVVFDYDFITHLAKYIFNNKVSLPKPLQLTETGKESIKNLAISHKIKRDVHITIATLVHNANQYRDFLFDLAKQQTDYMFEIITIPNFNKEFTSCAEPLNIAMDLADGAVINLCHQDLRVNSAWIEGISNHIVNLSKGKIKWGVLGMAGSYKYAAEYTPDKDGNALYLSDVTKNNSAASRSYASIYREVYGNYKEVQTVDELSLIIRKDSPFRFDSDTFDHFHWYGADLCLQAISKGYKNFAIDADCLHLSDGQNNLSGGHAQAFIDHGIKLFKKWSNTFPYFRTTTALFLSKEKLFIPVIFMVINRKNNNKKLPESVKIS